MDNTEEDVPHETDEEIISRELDENDLDPQWVLTVLVRAIVDRHVDCELRRLGGRPPWTAGNERLNALRAVMDTVWEYSRTPNGGFETSAAPELPLDDPINVRRMLMRLLGQCQFVAEKKVGLDSDDGPKPWMRLVKD